MTKNIYQFSCEDAKGNKVELNDYQGKTLLIVNTASKCGFTPQYEGLEELQKKYGSENFSVLAFPCNQFGGQEPCLLYTSPSPRDMRRSRMPSSA